MNVGQNCQTNQECRSVVCTQNVCRGNGNASRLIGDRCETNRQCINNNCVNNICARRSYTPRVNTGNMELTRLFSDRNSPNSGGGKLRKSVKKRSK